MKDWPNHKFDCVPGKSKELSIKIFAAPDTPSVKPTGPAPQKPVRYKKRTPEPKFGTPFSHFCYGGSPDGVQKCYRGEERGWEGGKGGRRE
jgi:hypothetical protein